MSSESLKQSSAHGKSSPTDFWEAAALFCETELNNAMAGCLAAMVIDIKSLKVVAASKFCDDVFAYGRGRLAGVHINELMPEEFRDRHDDLVEAWKKNPRAMVMGERRIPCLGGDGKQFTCTVHLTPWTENKALIVFFP